MTGYFIHDNIKQSKGQVSYKKIGFLGHLYGNLNVSLTILLLDIDKPQTSWSSLRKWLMIYNWLVNTCTHYMREILPYFGVLWILLPV